MRITGFIAGFLLAAVATARADDICGGYVENGPAAEAIRALELAGAEGNVKGLTTAQSEQMLAPGYVSVGPDGSVTPRDAALKTMTARPSVGWAEKFDVKSLEIKVYCDMAVATGTSEALPKGANAKPFHFRWLNVWTHSSGGWRLAATQFTRF